MFENVTKTEKFSDLDDFVQVVVENEAVAEAAAMGAFIRETRGAVTRWVTCQSEFLDRPDWADHGLELAHWASGVENEGDTGYVAVKFAATDGPWEALYCASDEIQV